MQIAEHTGTVMTPFMDFPQLLSVLLRLLHEGAGTQRREVMKVCVRVGAGGGGMEVTRVYVCKCVCMCPCPCPCVCACVCVRVGVHKSVCVRVRACVRVNEGAVPRRLEG